MSVFSTMTNVNMVGFYGVDDYHPEGSPTAVPFSQGWIYVIDDVLMIPPSISKIITYGNFNSGSFDTALEKTGLTEKVHLLHDTTYFIPDNDGFDAVKDSLEELSTEQLAEELKYHVVTGKV